MPRVLAICSVLLAAFFISGCSPLVRQRTLPPSIRSVYVPMIINRTAEPGVEEDLTVAVQEEFLADGRLDVVKRGQADAVVAITLTDWMRQATYFDDDDYAAGQGFDVEAEIEVIENIPGRPMIGGTRDVRTLVYFNADPRTTTFDPEPRVKEDAYRTLARMIVQEVISGEFVEFNPVRVDIENEDTVIRPSN